MMRRVLKLSRVALRRLPAYALATAVAFLFALAMPSPQARATDTMWTPIIPPGWEKVEPFDLLGTGDFGFRASQVSGYMDATGDFDGDGRPDQAAVFLNRHTGNLGVFVTLNARAVARVYKVIEVPANLLARIGISRAMPGEYKNACAKAPFNLAVNDGKICTPASFRMKYDGVAFFTFEAASKMIYWDGRGFVDEIVSD